MRSYLQIYEIIQIYITSHHTCSVAYEKNYLSSTTKIIIKCSWSNKLQMYVLRNYSCKKIKTDKQSFYPANNTPIHPSDKKNVKHHHDDNLILQYEMVKQFHKHYCRDNSRTFSQSRRRPCCCKEPSHDAGHLYRKLVPNPRQQNE